MLTQEGLAFDIHVVGDTTGQTWTGTFKAKDKLSFRDQITIDRIRRDLLGPNATGADPEIIAQVTVLAELAVRIIDAPNWWRESKQGTELHDTNVLMELYTAAMKVQDDAMARIREAGEKAKQDLRQMKPEKK